MTGNEDSLPCQGRVTRVVEIPIRNARREVTNEKKRVSNIPSTTFKILQIQYARTWVFQKFSYNKGTFHFSLMHKFEQCCKGNIINTSRLITAKVGSNNEICEKFLIYKFDILGDCHRVLL